MWTLGYIICWAVVIWLLFAGVLMLFIGSQFEKVLGVIGIVFLILGGLGGYKLWTLVEITVAVS